jgi:hypothetical protein
MNDITAAVPEKKESLWKLVISPAVWAMHFMLCYVTAAIWCAKSASRDVSLDPVRWAIAAFTVIALIAIALNGWQGYRAHRAGDSDLPHDDDTPADRHRFLGYATALLAGLSGVAVIYAGIVALFYGSCR